MSMINFGVLTPLNAFNPNTAHQYKQESAQPQGGQGGGQPGGQAGQAPGQMAAAGSANAPTAPAPSQSAPSVPAGQDGGYTSLPSNGFYPTDPIASATPMQRQGIPSPMDYMPGPSQVLNNTVGQPQTSAVASLQTAGQAMTNSVGPANLSGYLNQMFGGTPLNSVNIASHAIKYTMAQMNPFMLGKNLIGGG